MIGVVGGLDLKTVSEIIAFDSEVDLRPFAAADPVDLQLFQPFGPVKEFEVLEEPVGIGGDLQHPLTEGAQIGRAHV